MVMIRLKKVGFGFCFTYVLVNSDGTINIININTIGTAFIEIITAVDTSITNINTTNVATSYFSAWIHLEFIYSRKLLLQWFNTFNVQL